MQEMSYDPNYVIWSSFLNSCKIYGDVELGKEAADQLIKIEPYKAAPYYISTCLCKRSSWSQKAYETKENKKACRIR